MIIYLVWEADVSDITEMTNTTPRYFSVTLFSSPFITAPAAVVYTHRKDIRHCYKSGANVMFLSAPSERYADPQPAGEKDARWLRCSMQNLKNARLRCSLNNNQSWQVTSELESVCVM